MTIEHDSLEAIIGEKVVLCTGRSGVWPRAYSSRSGPDVQNLSSVISG